MVRHGEALLLVEENMAVSKSAFENRSGTSDWRRSIWLIRSKLLPVVRAHLFSFRHLLVCACTVRAQKVRNWVQATVYLTCQVDEPELPNWKLG